MPSFLIICCFFIATQTAFASDILINEVMSSNNHSYPDEDGDFVDWIELYNVTDEPIVLNGFYLSDDPSNNEKWLIPDTLINAHGFLLIYASGKNRNTPSEMLHANFKIKSSGELIRLTNAEGIVVDSLPATAIPPDCAFGRLPDGADNWGFLRNSSPEGSNNEIDFLSEIIFSVNSGFYDAPFYLKMDGTDSIRYTTNGSVPTATSPVYSDSIFISADQANGLSLIPTACDAVTAELSFQPPAEQVNKAFVLKAAAFRGGEPASLVYTKTYFTNGSSYSMPVISLVTDSLNLFDNNYGLFVPGANFDVTNALHTGNYHQRGMDWERSGTVEFFNAKGESEFVHDLGYRITGNRSRNTPQKSLRLYFRGAYGKSKADYAFFDGRDYEKYKRLVLRSTFSYWWNRNTLFQDELIHTIVNRTDSKLDVQCAEPVILYINGEYWGIQNLRERQDKYYLSYLHNIPEDSIDLIEGNYAPIEGSNETFVALMDFVEENDLSIPENYDYLRTWIDLENLIDYVIFESYFGNQDWPKNNVKLWRKQGEGEKWRFLFYDMDAAFGDVYSNPFQFSNSTGSVGVLFKALTKNSVFVSNFVDRYVHLLKTDLSPASVAVVFQGFKSKYGPEVSEHIRRWNNPDYYGSWEQNCDYLWFFLQNRPCVLRDHLLAYFDLTHLNNFDCFYLSDKTKFLRAIPNPSNGRFTIVLDDPDQINGKIELYNAQGQLVHEQPLTYENHQIINAPFLESGVYVVHVLNHGESRAEKVVIQR